MGSSSKKRKKHKHEKRSKKSSDSRSRSRSRSPIRQKSRSPSPPPRSSGGGDGSLSIDETNKLRIKLGLKPLQVNSTPISAPPRKQQQPVVPRGDDDDDEEKEGFDEETIQRIRQEREHENETYWKDETNKEFVHAPAENLGQKIQAEKIREKIKAVREKRRLEERLAGVKALADSDDDELDDAAKWVEKQKKAAEQKALAEKRAKALAELDDEFGIGDLVAQDYQKKKNNAYTSKDLRGMKVLHSQDRLGAGDSVILTLQDKGVLDEEDDTLVNVNMVDNEKFEKNIETRRLRPEFHGYNAYDEIEFDNDGKLKEKGVLSKYDEEINKGVATKSFVIGEDTSAEYRKAKILENMRKPNKILESLDATNLQVASDFYTSDEMVAFKKPKRKVRKVRKALRADDLLKMDSDAAAAAASSSSSSRHSDRHRERSSKDRGSRGKSDSKSKDSSYHHRHRDHHESSQAVKIEPVDMEVDLDINDLPPAPSMDDIWSVKVEDDADVDFQRALNKVRKLKQKAATIPSVEQMVDSLVRDNPHETVVRNSGNIVLHATAEFCRTLGDIPSVDGVDIYGDEEMDFETEEKKANALREEERGRWNEVEIDETPVDVTRAPEVEEAPILEQEPNVGTGLAGALRLAMKKGYLETEKVKRGVSVSKMMDLQAINYSIEDKNYEDDRSAKRDMYAGPTVDFKEKDHYKPDVKLDYVDEDGKQISSKEAFRLLSHKFHGKGSGKNKVDKKRRKIEQEKLMQHMNSTDTPLGTLQLLQQRQKDTQSAYVVLTGKAHTSLAKPKR